jgi:tRNA threonylcarbamoyladenosine biosynthesis protein TsaB
MALCNHRRGENGNRFWNKSPFNSIKPEKKGGAMAKRQTGVLKVAEFSKPVLAFDSSLGGCVGAVILNGKTLAPFSLKTDRDQAAKLVPLLQDMMKEAGIAFADLGLIVTTIGPGSFTGLRISLSAAKSFSLALGIPLQGISTLQVMAATAAVLHSLHDYDQMLVILETKREDYYTQVFNASDEMEPPTCRYKKEILNWCYERAGNRIVLCGDGVARLISETSIEENIYPCELLLPDILAKKGLELYIKNSFKAEKPKPLYMREADVSISKKTDRKIENFSY